MELQKDNKDFIDYLNNKLISGRYSKLFLEQIIKIDSNMHFFLGNTDFSEFRPFNITETILELEGGKQTSSKRGKRMQGKLSRYHHKHIEYWNSINEIFNKTITNENLINEAIKKAKKYKKDNKRKEDVRDLLPHFLVTDRIKQSSFL
jgi:hypothetical protein